VPKDNKNYLIPVVVGTFNVLGELSRAGPLNIADLASRTKVAKSTVFRILNTLHHLGYLWRDAESRTYSLSPRLSELARDVDWGTAMQRIALPHMVRLRSEFGETVNLARLDFDRVIYLEVVESEHALRMCERKGGWDHAHASALGKAILAFSPPAVVEAFLEAGALPKLTSRTLTDPKVLREELQKTRRRGYALEREESRTDASCVAAAICDNDGFAIAGISISGPVSRFNPSKDKRIASVLTETAQQISVALAEQIGHPAPSRLGIHLSA
jgi:DNA-binding IclR family transcriptional regulator